MGPPASLSMVKGSALANKTPGQSLVQSSQEVQLPAAWKAPKLDAPLAAFLDKRAGPWDSRAHDLTAHFQYKERNKHRL